MDGKTVICPIASAKKSLMAKVMFMCLFVQEKVVIRIY